MSGYNMESFLGDFANRTITNLNFIDDKAEEHSLYEVTQLMNSLLGLIIIPVEAYKNTYENGITDEILKDLSKKDYDDINKLLDRCKTEKRLYCDYYKSKYEKQINRISVSKFIKHLRNAIAHGGDHGIHFFPVSENDKISDIIFYDNNKMSKNNIINEFCIKLTVLELKALVENISRLYCGFEKRDEKTKKKQDTYNDDIRNLNYLMKNGRVDKSKVIFEFKEEQD